MRVSQGHSLSEYLIILVLVGVVAIPAIMMMGNTINNGYENAKPMSKASELFSLIEAHPKLDGDGGIVTSGPGMAASNDEIVYSSDAYTGLALEGTGSETTSGEGKIETVSATLQYIADTGTLPNGSSLPEYFDVQLIESLALQGEAINSELARIDAVEFDLNAILLGDYSGPHSLNFSDLEAQITTFLDDYSALENYVQTSYTDDPIATDLLTQVTDYSAIIRSSALEAGETLESEWTATIFGSTYNLDNFNLGFNESSVSSTRTNIPETPVASEVPILTEDVKINSERIREEKKKKQKNTAATEGNNRNGGDT